MEGIERKLRSDSRVAVSRALSALGRRDSIYLSIPNRCRPITGRSSSMFATTAIVKAVMSHARSVAQGNLSGSRDLAWKFEVRISGPALASGDNLRSLAAKGATIIEQNRLTDAVQTNWYQRVIKFEPEFYDARARWAGITREEVVRNIEQALVAASAYSMRRTKPCRLCSASSRMKAWPVTSPRCGSALTVPIDPVTDGISIKWEDPIIWRRDRKCTISLQANPIQGVTLPTYMQGVMPRGG